MTDDTAPRAELTIDLRALRANLSRIAELVGDAAVMFVVKADGYGHGMLEVARAARREGVPWLGVATVDEALALRDDGDSGRILSWLAVPGEDFEPPVDRDVDLSAGDRATLEAIARAAAAVGRAARVHLKVDTGLNRGGARLVDWPDLVADARRLESEGAVEVVGVWSHFACSDEPDHPANALQEQAFAQALEIARTAGLRPELRHLCNSAAAISRPQSRYDLVRIGLAGYGLSPLPQVRSAAELGLTPVMTARTRLALVKRVDAGASVSYGHTWTAPKPTTLGLVPVGYGEGVPRQASSRAEVAVAGARRPIAGIVCMDQFVVDLDDADSRAGDEVVLFGDGVGPVPTAQDWAEACGTISYEIVTRIGGRFVRRYLEADG